MADKYIIRVTAGHTYDLDDHVEVPVNQAGPVRIAHDYMDIELNVRVRDYRGLPRGSPAHSPYFDREPHAYNKDQYSIAFRFTPNKPAAAEPPSEGGDGSNSDEGEARIGNGTGNGNGNGNGNENGNGGGKEQDLTSSGAEEGHHPEGISAADLQFGNDFDHPIRDRLPPGFGTAMNIVRWWIDPGLEGDAYADTPYLYGPALSSFNAVHAGPGEHDDDKGGLWFDEGGDDAGVERRRGWGVPDDARARMKWALRAENKARWVWEYGRTYGVDFFNPYVDFNEFALRLPGFHLPIIKYWDGQGLRYVLRNRSTGQVYLVVLFTLYLKEDVNEDGSLKPAALRATAKASGGKGAKGLPMEDESDDRSDEGSFDEEKALEEARRKLSGVGLEGAAETNDDDVD